MKKAAMVMIATGLLTAPVQAADWSDVRPGTFVGARLTIGGRTGGRPSAALTLAPTQTRISNGGMTSMRVGEGIALNLTPGEKPTLTLAGVRADTALRLRRNGDVDVDEKLGVSTGGWVAIGLGTAAAIVGGLYLAADHIADCDEGECD
jgi:hypothetical protein